MNTHVSSQNQTLSPHIGWRDCSISEAEKSVQCNEILLNSVNPAMNPTSPRRKNCQRILLVSLEIHWTPFMLNALSTECWVGFIPKNWSNFRVKFS